MPNTTKRFRRHINEVRDAGALTNASFAVVTFSVKGELIAVNPAAAELFGTVENDPALTPQWGELLLPLVSELESRVSPSFERRVVASEGPELVVAVWRHDNTVQIALRNANSPEHRTEFKEAILEVMTNTGSEFFNSMVLTCAKQLGMNMVGLGRLSKDGHCVEVLTLCINGEIVTDTHEIPLEGMPCQDVSDKGFSLYSENVQERFPQDQLLKDLGAVGYLGLPVRDRDGNAIALLTMTSKSPISEKQVYRDILLQLADRTAAELERQTQITSLQTENTQARAILDNITDGIFINDTSGRMLHANPAMLKMLKYDLGKFQTLHVKDLIDPSDLAVQPVDLGPVLAGENIVHERRFITANSKVFRAEANIRLLPDGRIATVVRELKDRKRNTQRIKLSEERFRRVVESNMIGVYFWNMDGEITDANDRFLRQFGYSRQSLARGDLNWKRMTPDEWRRIDNINMKLIRRDGQIEPYEKQLFHSEGHELPVLVGAALYEGTNEGVAFVLELSEMKATERALHESQTSLSTLIDNLPGVVFRAQITPDWPMTYVSDSIKELSGYSADEFINRRRFLADIIHPDDAHDVWESRQQAIDQQRQFQISYRVVNKNHEETWVWEQSRPVFNDDGKVVAIEGFIADNSERRLLEEQLQQAQKLESIGRLAGGVAHDFNNLLTAVLGYSDFALMYTQDSKLKEFLHNIRSAAERGATLTRQLLGFARKQIVEPQTFSPNTRINDIQKMLSRLIGEDIELVFELNPESGLVRVDPSQFEQVLVNLIVNARDAMPEGGLLKIRSAPVDLGEEFVHEHPEVIKGKYVRFDIEDTGHGIDAETMEKIFEPFFTTKAKGKGKGLGLATCYGIIKQNLGHINVSSAPGHGALFTVYLPRIEAPDRISLMADKQPNPDSDYETVLLVEDEPVVRQLCLGALMGQGYHVLTAANGEEALRLVKEDRAKFDLLVTDFVMPKMSGTELVEELCKILPDLQVLFVSGYAGEEAIQRDLLDGVEFLKKPFSPAQLTQRVREVLERKIEDSK